MTIEISNITHYPRVLVTARVTGSKPLALMHGSTFNPDQIEVSYRQTGMLPHRPWEVTSLVVYGEGRKKVWWPDTFDEAPEWVRDFVNTNMPKVAS